MVDNPSGMVCGLTTNGLLSIGGGSGSPFVVGGGRYARGSLLGPGSVSNACGINWSMSAHLDSTGLHGEQSYTINNADGCGPYSGHVHATVTCLQVFGNEAEIKGDITEKTGFFSTLPTTVFVSDVTDNGPPSGGVRDGLYMYDDYPPDSVCAAPGQYSFYEIPIDNGNITVHSG
jgi:hypothetical protein